MHSTRRLSHLPMLQSTYFANYYIHINIKLKHNDGIFYNNTRNNNNYYCYYFYKYPNNVNLGFYLILLLGSIIKVTLVGHFNNIYAVVAFKNGDLASADIDERIIIWGSSTYQIKRTLNGHIGWI
jgi:hypothetical protein